MNLLAKLWAIIRPAIVQPDPHVEHWRRQLVCRGCRISRGQVRIDLVGIWQRRRTPGQIWVSPN